MWLRDTCHIGIHEGADGRTDGRTYVCTDVQDIMAIKPNFLTSMGYHIFLTMVLRYKASISNSAEKPYLSLSTHFKTVCFYCKLGLVCSLQVSDTAFQV